MRPSWPCSASCSTRGHAEVKGCLSVSEHTRETERTVELAAIDCPVVAESEVVVVGGGPAGVAAAVSAARSGVSVTLLERYPALGGLASGGMVLVLDDMINGQEITVTGIVSEYVDRLLQLGLAVLPPEEDRYASTETWNKWGRYGAFDFHTASNPK